MLEDLHGEMRCEYDHILLYVCMKFSRIKEHIARQWWHMPLIPAVRRQMQDDQEFRIML